MNVPEGWPTRGMLIVGHDEMWDSPNAISAQDASRIFVAMLEAAPTPPEPEDAPVAYTEKGNGQLWPAFEADQMLSDDIKRTQLTPLYTHPADDGLRKAAAELLAEIDSKKTIYAGNKYAENLRAAMKEAK